MNASILGRIFWKEYRTQRDLWLAIVGICSSMMVVLSLFLSERDQPYVETLFGFGMMASVFYVLASASILYAAEHEQGTKTWLGVLPLNPAELMLPKVAWVVSSTLAAIATFWLVAQLFGQSVSNPAGFPNDGLLAYSGFLCLVLACGMLGSQLSRQVLKAIGLALVLLVGTYVLVSSLTFSGHMLLIAIATIIFFPLGVSIFLNQRWLRESSFTWQWSIPLGRQFTLDRALTLPLETSSLERTWRRQIWLEWRNSRAWVLGIALTSVLLMSWLLPGVEVRGQIVGFFFSIIACLVPLLCGVASCRGEQLHQRYLFQGNRGASSGQLLLAKHLVWMSFGAILILGLGWWGISQIPYTTPSDMGRGGGLYSFSLVPLPAHNLSNELRSLLESSLLPGIQLIATIALMSYTIGHFCSLLFSQQILGLFVAVLGTSISVSIVLWGYSIGVPLYVLTFVPAISLFLLSLRRGRDWIIARSDRKDWLRYFAWSLLGVWTWFSLFAGWRVAEVRWSAQAASGGLFQLRYLYPILCAGLLVACLLGVSLVEFVRRNSKPGSDKPPFGKRRWLTPVCLLIVFLVGHNSLIALGLTASSIQSQSDSSELREVARAMTYRTLDNTTGPDLYLNARDRMTSNLPQEESDKTISVPQFMPQKSLERPNPRTEYLWNTWNDISEAQRIWLTANEQALDLFDEADRSGVFDRTAIVNDTPDGYLLFQGVTFLDTDARLLSLVRLKALEREHAGELSEAWEYHLKLIRFVKRALNDALPLERTNIQSWLKTVVIENDLARWQSRNEQTPELLAQAARDLSRERENWPSLGRAYALAGGLMWELIRNPSENWRATTLGMHFPSWERERAMAVVEQITRTNAALAHAIEQAQVWRSPDVSRPTAPISIAPAELVQPGIQQLIIVRENSIVGAKGPRLALKTQSMRQSDLFELTRYEGPWDLVLTTYILRNPPRIDFFLSIHDRPEPLLIEEIDFRIAVQNWLANCETETPLSAPKPTQETP